MRTQADLSGRVPVHAVWELTLACNLRCVHCGSRAGRPRQDELNTSECLDVVDQLAELGTRQVTLIGGEAYLRRDWLQIVRAVADSGMICSLQTGGRGLTPAKIAAARDAGLRAAGVSIDGLPVVHDQLRGVPGSYESALRALRAFREANIRPGVNTQLNHLSVGKLRELLLEIASAGAGLWQLQLTVPAGNAADRPELIIQPYEIPPVLDEIASVFHFARSLGVDIIPGNNIGYFGPHEHLWRTLSDRSEYWQGCQASSTTLGIEADGTIKGCPSFHKDDYAGGNIRKRRLADIWATMAGSIPSRDAGQLWGYCGGCYYRSTCSGGCTWTAASVMGRPGNNPFCDHRARSLARMGLRERLEFKSAARTESFATGAWRLWLEDEGGAPSLEPERTEEESDRTGPLKLCGNCSHFVYADEARCFECGEALIESSPSEHSSPHEEVRASLRKLRELDAAAAAALHNMRAFRHSRAEGDVH